MVYLLKIVIFHGYVKYQRVTYFQIWIFQSKLLNDKEVYGYESRPW